MIILISGDRLSGKSSLASLLAELFGIPAIVNTDAFYEILQVVDPKYQENQIQTYDEICQSMQPLIVDQIRRRVQQNKSAIFEGVHISPFLYQNIGISSQLILVKIFVETDDFLRKKVSEMVKENPKFQESESIPFSLTPEILADFSLVSNNSDYGVYGALNQARNLILNEMCRCKNF